MGSRRKHLFVIGTAVGVVQLSSQLWAAAVEPIEVQGRPSVEGVAELCQFPKVIEKGEITSPVEIRIEPPHTGIFPPEGPKHGIFQVRIELEGETLAFEDVSSDPNSPKPDNSQFWDVVGTEAVVAESSNKANVYCNVNSIRDKDLRAPSGELAVVRVFWSLGASGFTGQDELQPVCDALNDKPDRITDFFIAHHTRNDPRFRREVTLEGPIDFSGCNDHVPRFCNVRDPRGEEFVVSCDFSGFDLITDSIVLGTCSGSSGGSRIRC